MFNPITERSRTVIGYAKEEALRFGQNDICPEHLLIGLHREGSGIAAVVLQKNKINLETLRNEAGRLVPNQYQMKVNGAHLFSLESKKVLDSSAMEAQALGHRYIGTEHMLLGLISEGNNMAGNILLNLGLDLSKIRNDVFILLNCGIPKGGQEANSWDDLLK